MREVDILPAPDLDLTQGSQPGWEAERRSFYRLLPTLLATHRGKFVAIHNSSVVAEGLDQIDVAKQAYGRAGYVPIYVGLVTDEPPAPVRIPSPRLPSSRR
jgi:hypothetical protein